MAWARVLVMERVRKERVWLGYNLKKGLTGFDALAVTPRFLTARWILVPFPEMGTGSVEIRSRPRPLPFFFFCLL